VAIGLFCILPIGFLQASPPLSADGVSIPRRAWEAAQTAWKGKGPTLWIQAPREDEIYSSDRVRFAGCTEPGSMVRMNGEDVRVYPTGTFVEIGRAHV